DGLALRGFPQGDASAYGELLLRFAEDGNAAKRAPALGLISFASGRHLKQRVELLMRDKNPNGLVSKTSILTLVAAVAFTGLTDAKTPEQKMPELHLVASSSTEPQLQPLWLDPYNVRESDGPTFVAEYDVESILETMPKSLASSQK